MAPPLWSWQAKSRAADWAGCCAACAAAEGCAHWTWSARNAPLYCHLHGASATANKGSGHISGSMQTAAQALVVPAAARAQCGGGVTNGTRPGADYASVKIWAHSSSKIWSVG